MQKITSKPKKFDVIITLGISINSDNTIPPILKGRLDECIKISKKNLSDKIIVSGSHCVFRFRKGMITQAEAMKRYLLKKGISESCIIKEESSLDTIGEAYFVKTDILELNKWFNPVIITSDFHIKRTRYIFNKVLGNSYNPRFIGSKFNFREDQLKKLIKGEEKLLKLTKKWLGKIKDGDDRSVKNFLYKKHPLYLSSKNLVHRIFCRFIVPTHYRRPFFLKKESSLS